MGTIAKAVFGAIFTAIKAVLNAFKTIFSVGAKLGRAFGGFLGGGVASVFGTFDDQKNVNKIFSDVDKLEKSSGNKSVDNLKKTEKMKTKASIDAMRDRKNKVDALVRESERKGGAGRILIDPFAIGPQIRRRGRSALAGAGGAGFGAKAIQAARGQQASAGQTINIDKVELPNVTDRESFSNELLKIQQSSGQLTPAQLS